MALSLRRTGLSSPVYADKADYCVIEDGKVIGRIYQANLLEMAQEWFNLAIKAAEAANGGNGKAVS